MRLDSFEDYEIIGLDSVQGHCDNMQSSSTYSINKDHKENSQVGYFDYRFHHPAAYVQPPHTHSDRKTCMHLKNQQQLQNPSFNIWYQRAESANQFSPCPSHCQVSRKSQQHYPKYTGYLDTGGYRPGSFENLKTTVPHCDNLGKIMHHVPYNLTKGQYEYWMSVPGAGRNNTHWEAMQGYSQSQFPFNSGTAGHIPVSRTISLGRQEIGRYY